MDDSSDKLKALVIGWYNEVLNMTFKSKADYSIKGLELVFNEVLKVRGYMSRLEFLISEARFIKRQLTCKLEGVLAGYDESLDKLKVNPMSMINKGFSYHEREATYRSSPELLKSRIQIRLYESLIADLNMFLEVALSRMKYLDSSKNDLNLQTNLIRLGYNNLELK